MSKEQKSHEKQAAPQGQQQGQEQGQQQAQPQNQQQANDVDGLADKKPEELTPEELRLMADTMPGEGPGD
ncbi:hypothetical protein ACWV27_19920 [Massilia varians]|uniref:hypothetical protein n=1 Tax=Massilia sp. LC238 TaxID=1502852 RepID=UPI0004E4176D|nr:hypothetical protein [Massilia sp. LC238]KFC65929.1 hypothetical protein FG94_03487 [Massilia sp. LC238]